MVFYKIEFDKNAVHVDGDQNKTPLRDHIKKLFEDHSKDGWEIIDDWTSKHDTNYFLVFGIPEEQELLFKLSAPCGIDKLQKNQNTL